METWLGGHERAQYPNIKIKEVQAPGQIHEVECDGRVVYKQGLGSRVTVRGTYG